MALPTSAGGKGPVLMLLLALAYCYDTYGYCRCCHEQGEGACSSKEEEKLESAEWVFPAKVGLASTKIAVGMERYCANKSGGRPCGVSPCYHHSFLVLLAPTTTLGWLPGCTGDRPYVDCVEVIMVHRDHNAT
ncbi:hypothetical protein SNK03_012450 [Fusarium graminearum]|uniref:Chromosome 3, complete genome n=1 Tax=Gibberella zeae (strain ATCC MYA-4620 / CBS 123657 / FGSC 9075 / NRRL 31084 / PH-1) TaxID=229533 RepID=I1S7T7_GIBZE|nr:hypothetical protein FGSG_12912 [Fusarium graminearum PH-1]ESU12444.1 hypothetical protein FGSG_12912 [Fusarium graminearum PH-1]CEF86384.1 unnamed protein product [Fusarium graminearum]CZS85160.1 unnamed protein product [Fusarium graminearum]|eukprot:XP_011325020.1 hypothetical protein FGSG_12912 [Fusarium graminearum PH-1]